MLNFFIYLYEIDISIDESTLSREVVIVSAIITSSVRIVCQQGYFVPNGYETYKHRYRADESFLVWPTYKYCDLQTWCNYTNEFECDQLMMSYSAVEIPSGPSFRHITGIHNNVVS